jgi:hypothetical protein
MTSSSRSASAARAGKMADPRPRRRLVNTLTESDAADEASGGLGRWPGPGGSGVPEPATASCGLDRLDQGRADSMADEGGRPHGRHPDG